MTSGRSCSGESSRSLSESTPNYAVCMRRCGIERMGLGQSRRRWLVGFSLPLVLLATALFVAHTLAPSRAGGQPAGSSEDLSILSWNVNGSLVMPDVIAAEVARQDPDVLVLPSIDDGELDQLERLLRPRGYIAARHSGSQVVVYSRVGYRLEERGDTSPRQTVAKAPGLPTIVALHERGCSGLSASGSR